VLCAHRAVRARVWTVSPSPRRRRPRWQAATAPPMTGQGRRRRGGRAIRARSRRDGLAGRRAASRRAELESSPNHRVNFFLKRDGLAAYSHGEGRPSQEERERACPAAVSASQVFAHELAKRGSAASRGSAVERWNFAAPRLPVLNAAAEKDPRHAAV
jgi:hypothetical protein